jgi:hypothetical membrane protein
MIIDRFGPRGRGLAGAALFSAGLVAFMGIITAEALYPGYSTSGNMISDLGATDPPDSVIIQPSSNIFSGSMLVTGLLVLFAVPFIEDIFRARMMTVSLGLLGVGITGVGVFNGSWGGVHALFALTTFVSGGIAAAISFQVLRSPLRYVSMALGAISLTTLAIYFLTGEDGILGDLGPGGIERWVAYPILMWILGLGGYVMGMSEGQVASART